MPTYTNPKTGKRIKSAKALNQQQLEEAFNVTSEAPPPDENNVLQDVAEGAGLPSSLDELGSLLQDNAINATLGPGLGTARAGVNAIEGLYKDSSARTGRFWDTLSNDPSISRAAQLMMAPIPGLGNIMENADKAIVEGDTHAMGRLGGNALALAAPKMIEHAPAAGRLAVKAANSTPGRTLIGAGAGYGLGGKFGALEGALTGYYGKGLPGRLGRVGKAMFGDRAIPALDEPMDVTSTIKAEVDPRIAELKDLRLQNALAKEKGILPQGEGDISTTDLTELKRLKLERQLEAERGSKLEREGALAAEVNPEELTPVKEVKSEEIVPVSKGSAVADEGIFPVKYKNVRLKQEYAPQPPNPYSRQDLPSGTDELELGASPDQKMGVPVKTHEELAAVQDLVASGMSQEDAVRLVTSQPVITGKVNPRALGTNPRKQGTNPRALAEKRRGL